MLQDDLDVPVIVLNSEWESAECYPNHQDDTELLRWWEVPGAGHIGTATPAEMELAGSMGFGGIDGVVRDPRFEGPSTRRRVGSSMVTDPRISPGSSGRATPALARDEHGNAVGGIRWPDLEAPLGTHVGET